MTKRQARRSLFSSGNAAFAIVVCASYASGTAAMFYSHRPVTRFEAAVLLTVAIAYLFVGTIGFTRVRESRSLLAGVVYFVIPLSPGPTFIGVRGSTGELSLTLLPLAGQTALSLPIYLTVPLCLSIYTILVMPFLLRGRWIDAIALAVIYGTGIVFVVVFTRVAASEREARTALAEANQLLRDHASQVEELATTKERNRLAREIHDSVGHYLTVVNVQIGAAQAVLQQDRARALDHLTKAQTLTQEGLAEIRRSVAALRSAPVESRPLPEALKHLVEQWNAAGRDAKFEVMGKIRVLSPQAELTLYRTAQEALTNVNNHAKATRVDVLLDYTREHSVLLKVEDYGVGTDEVRTGFGLSGIRERVQLLRGEVQIQTAVGRGFGLEVKLPT